MAATEFIVRLTVVRANSLPKTDLLSKIDPYIVVRCNGGTFKTRAFDNNEDPIWNEVFHPVVPRHPGGLFAGTISFDLYDKNTMSDKQIGTATWQLETINPEAQGGLLDVNLSFDLKEKYAKQKRPSNLTVRIDGWVQTYSSLRNMMSTAAGVLFDDSRKRLYVPVVESGGLVYVGVEYDGPNVDLKVYLTQPGSSLFLDMVYPGREKTKVIRKTYHQGMHVLPGLTVYEEACVDDVPISTDFNNFCIICFDAVPLSSTNSDTIVTSHGWRGALNFAQASQVLHGVDIDYDKQEIYMPIDPGETLLLIDYDEDDADIKLAVLATPATTGKAYDLTIRGQNVKKYSEIYLPHKNKLGKYAISRVYELDDISYGTSFIDIEVHRMAVSNPRQHSLQSITRIHG